MSTPIKLMIVALIGLGVGFFAWGLSGSIGAEVVIVRAADGTNAMLNNHGAIAIGAGALSAAIAAITLFSPGTSTPMRKPFAPPDSLD